MLGDVPGANASVARTSLYKEGMEVGDGHLCELP